MKNQLQIMINILNEMSDIMYEPIYSFGWTFSGDELKPIMDELQCDKMTACRELSKTTKPERIYILGYERIENESE